MEQNRSYRYQPTENGIRYRSLDARDPERKVPCVLYPDNRRAEIFDSAEMELIAKYPFRPVVLAKLAPTYELDMHCVSGMSGYGRFAVSRGDTVLLLDEFKYIETEYHNGEVRYIVQDDRISEKPVHVFFIAGRGACGLIIRMDRSNWDESIDIYYLHGGMLGWHTHSPLQLAYDRDMCWGNAITVAGECARIRLEESNDVPNPYHLNQMHIEVPMSVNRLWRVLDGWKQQIFIRAEGATLFTAPPNSLNTLIPGYLRTTSASWGEVVCAKLPAVGVCHAAVGLGKELCNRSLTELFEEIRSDNTAIAKRLVVRTGNTEFDGAVTSAAFPTDGVFGDNVYLHGNLSWREGYQGWRVAYGPLAYGMTRTSEQHFENHFKTTLITEGPDAGAFCSTLEKANPSGKAFYNMHQTFLHQARRHWEYTGDKAFAERLLPIVEGCIKWDIRRIKPTEEMLFENCLNTWISDHHWSIMGQCTQASAYLYNIHRLASELADELGDASKKTYYADKANEIKQAMNSVLWQTRKGVYAYAKDTTGNQMLHTEPELGDVYHPTELGVTDVYQTYQMLDWAEANLRWEQTDNGGRLCHSSNWHPNGGDKYSHSIDEINGGDMLNLALAYQEIGLAEPAYDIFRSFYQTLYGGRDPKVYDFNSGIYRLKGEPPSQVETVLNLPCHLTTNGTARLNALFSDTISMYGREIYEGILGVRPKLQKNELWLTPCIPTEMPHVDMQSSLIDYVYDRTSTSIRLQYGIKRSGCTLYVKLRLPVSEIDRVLVDGSDVAYTLEPDFCGLTLTISLANASEGTVEASFRPVSTLSVEARRHLTPDATLNLCYEHESIVGLHDPQGIFADAVIEKGSLAARVANTEGSGVVFLRMRNRDVEYIRPVKVKIGERRPVEVFKSFREEFTAPYQWKTIDMDSLFNHRTPREVAESVISKANQPDEMYNQVNFNYYSWHACGVCITENPLYGLDIERWRSLIDENGIAVTGEGIPFRSCRDGNCMAAATLVSPAYSDRIVTPIGDTGRAAYLLITGITFPMQSHVENLRIIIRYEDGTEEEHPLFNPDGIGDMWSNEFERYHDTPANGFENIGGGRGALSSVGMDLTKQIYTDLEAHILRFHLREGIAVQEIEMRVMANDVIFALMGITLLK